MSRRAPARWRPADGEGGLLVRILRRAAGPGVVASIVVILALTLTQLGAGPRGTPPGFCTFGISCAVGHFATFVLLGVALAAWFATSRAARRSPRRVLAMLILAIWLFAALDELAQNEVGRDAELDDWLVDMAGALVGLFGGSALLRAVLRRPPD